MFSVARVARLHSLKNICALPSSTRGYAKDVRYWPTTGLLLILFVTPTMLDRFTLHLDRGINVFQLFVQVLNSKGVRGNNNMG